MSAPLSSCSNNFNTNDENDCFTIEHDQRTGGEEVGHIISTFTSLLRFGEYNGELLHLE